MPTNDLSSLAENLRQLPDRLERNLRGALHMAATEAAAEARTTHDYTDRTSTLTNSIDADGPRGSFASGNLEATVSAGAPYALYVEKGTRPHEIKPKYRRFLRWPIEGGFRFARKVRHPGTKPTNFLGNAVDNAVPKLASDHIPDAVELSFLQSGFRP